MIRIFITTLSIIALVACAAQGQLSSIPLPTDPDNAAELTIIRKSEFFGGGASNSVALDHNAFVAMRTGDYVTIKLSPGRHVISVLGPKQIMGGNRFSSDFEVNVESGTSTFVLFESDAPGFGFTKIDPVQGQKYINKYTKIELVQ